MTEQSEVPKASNSARVNRAWMSEATLHAEWVIPQIPKATQVHSDRCLMLSCALALCMSPYMLPGVAALEGGQCTLAHDVAGPIALLVGVVERIEAWVEGLIEAIVATKASHLTLHPSHLTLHPCTCQSQQLEKQVQRYIEARCCSHDFRVRLSNSW